MTQPTSPAGEKPTRVRYGVLGFSCALSMITYLDRVCFGSAAGDIQRELQLTETELAWVNAAFTTAYASFEIPTGWLGDVFGPKRTLIRIVLWWSAFTVFTGLVSVDGLLFLSGLGLLILVRFLFGMGEAGAYPNITRALHNWFPARERAFAQGTVWMSGRFMGGITPIIWLLIIGVAGLNWRIAFYIFGAIGTVWCLSFWLWFRDRPRDKQGVNAAEIELIEAGKKGEESAHSGVPWKKLFGSANLWALCMMYFCAAYGWYFNITFLPKFMDEQYGAKMDGFVGALLKGMPLWMGAMACLVGGWLSDLFISRTGNRKWGRRLFGVVGHSMCALCYLACLFTPTAFTFILAVSLAAFWNDLTMGAAWATCQDIGRRYSAIVAGCMNTIGNLGGTAVMLVMGAILGAFFARGAASVGVTSEEGQKDMGIMAQAEIREKAKDPEQLAALADDLNVSVSQLVLLQEMAPKLGKPKEEESGLKTIAGELNLTVDDVKELRHLRERVATKQRGRFLIAGYRINFAIFGGVYLLAVLLWLRVDPTKPVAPEAEGH